MSAPPFGLRLRRVADRIGGQGQHAFSRLGIRLDARKASLVYLMHEGGAATSTELAAASGLSRQLVEARLKQLVAANYVTSAPSPNDARKRMYSLMPEARADAERAIAAMKDFEAVFRDLWRETGLDANAALAALEAALERRPLLGRLCERFPHHQEAAEETVP
ncbi:MAG: MarR family transcriptional regulator [Xanthomonadales bacterium]|nr:MarR family transcriptional regulator [Xanthomonadales bacterium]